MGWHVPAIARAVRLNDQTVRLWIKRLNADGLDGLREHLRVAQTPKVK